MEKIGALATWLQIFAADEQRSQKFFLMLDVFGQPNFDIHARCGEGAAASAIGFPKADIQVYSIDPSDAGPGFNVNEAQFAKLLTSIYP